MVEQIQIMDQPLSIKYGANCEYRNYLNPFMVWVAQQAPNCNSAIELTTSFVEQLQVAKLPIARLMVLIPILHPQVDALFHQWESRTQRVEESNIDCDTCQMPGGLMQALEPLYEGASGVRYRVGDFKKSIESGLSDEFIRSGATDYVVLPMIFSDGKINGICLISDALGGFSTKDLGFLYEILPMLARIYEVHILKRNTTSLLNTYLGEHAGKLVLEGRIKRGDGKNVEAVIWYCDLRGSTARAHSMSRSEFLEYLSEFFDCAAGAVLDNGGQILRYIGDAALAIFPIEPKSPDSAHRISRLSNSCNSAINAAVEAMTRVKLINKTRKLNSKEIIKFGIALHIGEVTFGNIGTKGRLEFTIIGDAVNRTSRMESFCKLLDVSLIFSAKIAKCQPDRFKSLGDHRLEGVDGLHELFTLAKLDF